MKAPLSPFLSALCSEYLFVLLFAFFAQLDSSSDNTRVTWSCIVYLSSSFSSSSFFFIIFLTTSTNLLRLLLLLFSSSVFALLLLAATRSLLFYFYCTFCCRLVDEMLYLIPVVIWQWSLRERVLCSIRTACQGGPFYSRSLFKSSRMLIDDGRGVWCAVWSHFHITLFRLFRRRF